MKASAHPCPGFGNDQPMTNTDGNRTVAENFANILVRAYLEASDEIQEVIREMSRISADASVDQATRDSALDTLMEALFPQTDSDGLGISLLDVKMRPADGSDAQAIVDAMTAQEVSFASRLKELMDRREISQVQLAELTGVGQPAISNMLNRQCRPQRRTIEKLATALGVHPTDLWPT